jgi:flavin-dependent dehydrogenase
MTCAEPPDILVIGGGPAGSTAARLLAQWGHQVTLLTAPPAHRALAECLPPSTKKVFQFLGIQDAIAAAVFFETRGNTVWWAARGKRVEPYPAGFGYQVDRTAFDRLLLELARSAGVSVRWERVTPARSTFDAKFVLDCSGRAGVLAREFRVKPQKGRAVALCGMWRSEHGWTLPDASHTLVESYGHGWAWSVPLSPTVRHVAFMVNPIESHLLRGRGIEAAYAAELARTRAFRKIFARGRMEGTPWGRDASPYTSREFGGPRFLLVGDAGSFIDPLSSFGVKKAMVSAWRAAVVANTCLRRPPMQETALRYFAEREREMQNHHREQAAHWLSEETGGSTEAQPEFMQSDAGEVERALEGLRRRKSIRLQRGESVKTCERAGIEGREVLLRDALITPGNAAPLDFVANVNVVRLVEMAPDHRHVPDLFESYNRACGPAELPDFLMALATLVAKGVLVSR